MANATVLVGMVGVAALLVGACGSGDRGAGTPPDDDGKHATSGQTGSVVCAENISAACSALAAHVIVELEVVAVDPEVSLATFAITAAMNPSPSFNEEDVGRTLAGPYTFFPLPDAKNQEGSWTLDQASRLAPGDRVIGTFRESEYRAAHCPGYSECMEPCERANNDFVVLDACSDACAEACVPERSSTPWATALWLLPLAESYDFAGEVIARSELAELSDRSHCLEVFPTPAAPPCNDTDPSE